MENLSNQDEFNALKCKLFEIGVNCFMLPNVLSERFPTSLNQETLEALQFVSWPYLVIEESLSY